MKQKKYTDLAIWEQENCHPEIYPLGKLPPR